MLGRIDITRYLQGKSSINPTTPRINIIIPIIMNTQSNSTACPFIPQLLSQAQMRVSYQNYNRTYYNDNHSLQKYHVLMLSLNHYYHN